MSPDDVKTVYELLANRVVPQSAREGAAIMALGARLVSHFAKPPAPPQDAPTMQATQTSSQQPDPTPPQSAGS